MELRQLQQMIQDYCLQGSSAAVSHLVRPDNMSIENRLQIYRDAYFVRLTELLTENFSVLAKLLGKSAFAAMVRSYLAQFPSRYYSVSQVGQHLAQFLAETKDCHPSLVEIADFEWQLNLVLYAADAPSLSLQELAQIPESEWPQLQLELHPAIKIVSYHYNTVLRWEAVYRDDKEIGGYLLERPGHYLLWRKQRQSTFIALSEPEYALLQHIERQVNFEQMCSAMLCYFDEEAVVAWVADRLQQWLSDGVFQSFLV